jgi:hypothetical protein
MIPWMALVAEIDRVAGRLDGDQLVVEMQSRTGPPGTPPAPDWGTPVHKPARTARAGHA